MILIRSNTEMIQTIFYLNHFIKRLHIHDRYKSFLSVTPLAIFLTAAT